MPADTISAYTVRDPAWWDAAGAHDHDRYPDSVAEARKWAGQEFEWVERPSYAIEPIVDPATFAFRADDRVLNGPDGTPVEVVRAVERERRIVRSDTGEHVVTRPKSFEVISVAETWAILEALADQPNVLLETGGVLAGSGRIWALARLDEPYQAPGDPSLTYPYVVVLNAITGKLSCKAVNTDVRVVCANTFSAADAQGRRTGREFVFRHTAGVHDRIAEAKSALRGVRAESAAWQEIAAELASLRVTPAQTTRFVDGFIPMPPQSEITKVVKGNVDAARAQLRAILASETCAILPDTAYKLVQAGGEYCDHVRGYRNRDTLLGRQLIKPQRRKAQAVALARAVARDAGTDPALLPEPDAELVS